jgi:Cu/Zn superoxide dismutase
MLVRVALTAAMALFAPAAAPAQDSADARFTNIQAREIGWARLTETPHGVLIEGYVTDLHTGAHGFHP